MQEKMPESEHPDLSATLNNLATLYNGQRQYAKAEPLYQRALAILEKGVGTRASGYGPNSNKLQRSPKTD